MDDMKMTSMKMEGGERKEYAQPTLAMKEPEYPYGLCLCLDEATIAKLGIATLPKVGQTGMLHAKYVVKSVSDSNSAEMGRQRRLELQVTDMGMASEKGKSPAKALYGDE